jgi:hypothetical protein
VSKLNELSPCHMFSTQNYRSLARSMSAKQAHGVSNFASLRLKRS